MTDNRERFHSMQCSKCRSHNTQSVSVAHSQSIRTGYNGHQTISEFGRDLEPPAAQSVFGFPLLATINIFGLAVFLLPGALEATRIQWLQGLLVLSWQNLAICGFLALYVGFRLAISAVRHNMDVHSQDMSSWKRGVICKRCGHRFLQ